jgi:hypothetical protein
VAARLESLVKSVGVVLGERKRLARIEKRLVKALNNALGKMGYKVIHANAAAPGRRRRRRVRRRTRPARPRRQVRGRRTRTRGKKS